MLDHLYRFRSIHALLDGYQELESQQIYFSPTDKLNDPLEGFKDIFWRGDHIVWRNLLRHYLLNLMQAISLAAVMGKEFTYDVCETLVHQTDSDLPEAPIRDIYSTACREFFKYLEIEQLTTTLSLNRRVVRRDELIYLLRLIHPLAMRKVMAAFESQGLPLLKSMAEIDAMMADMCRKLDDALRAYMQLEESSGIFFSACEMIQSQHALLHEFNNWVANDRRPWLFILRDFPSCYVDALGHLLYPDWHVACFVSDPTNASMWGAYGGNHSGACLKFKARADTQGFPTLDLYRANSWSGGTDGTTAHYAYVPHRFEKVQYTSDFPEFDFFDSIGTLPRSKLDGFWFAEHNGEHSKTALRIRQEDDTWRQEYWRKFSISFSTKTSDWSHEKEHRLILHSNLQRFDDLESRKLKYRFTDLAGIIFGIKTTTEDKLRIMRIIERKCIAEERQDFEFHQAYYSVKTKKIELAPLTMLKVK